MKVLITVLIIYISTQFLIHYLAKDHLKIFIYIYLKYLFILICISSKKVKTNNHNNNIDS